MEFNGLCNPHTELNHSHMGLNHSLEALHLPQMGLMNINLSLSKRWSGQSQQRSVVILPAARKAICSLKAPLQAFHSTRLVSSKAVAYGERTFQDIHNKTYETPFYSPK